MIIHIVLTNNWTRIAGIKVLPINNKKNFWFLRGNFIIIFFVYLWRIAVAVRRLRKRSKKKISFWDWLTIFLQNLGLLFRIGKWISTKEISHIFFSSYFQKIMRFLHVNSYLQKTHENKNTVHTHEMRVTRSDLLYTLLNNLFIAIYFIITWCQCLTYTQTTSKRERNDNIFLIYAPKKIQKKKKYQRITTYIHTNKHLNRVSCIASLHNSSSLFTFTTFAYNNFESLLFFHFKFSMLLSTFICSISVCVCVSSSI